MPIGMLVTLDAIFNQVIQNWKNGRTTWVFADEFYLLFRYEYSADFFYKLWKRIRKYNGLVTGVDAKCGRAPPFRWFRERGLWQDNTYVPNPGDIIFFNWDGDGLVDHVGIVEKVENSRVYTIEGNSSNACRQNSYPLGYSKNYGYGILSDFS